MVGLEGFEPVTYGLGNLVTLLNGFENSLLYYIHQQLTNSMILGRVPVLIGFERITTTFLLQFPWPRFGTPKGRLRSGRSWREKAEGPKAALNFVREALTKYPLNKTLTNRERKLRDDLGSTKPIL
jgi:hypothetical protein